MFDIVLFEFLLFVLVVLIVIGFKDLFKVMCVVGWFVGKVCGMVN